jgi:hypothetical protein
MTKYFLLVAVFLVSCKTKESKNQAEVRQNHLELVLFNNILKDLDSIIGNSSNKNITLEKNFKFILKQIQEKKVTIIYDTSLNYSFRGCAAASYVDGDTSNYRLSFGNYVIDKYNYFPFLIQGIIIHEFQHLNDLFLNKNQMVVSENNPIEKTYFEMDALYQESQFIKTYVGKRKNLSPIEGYLLADENLLGTAILFQEVDLELLHSMDDIKAKKVSFEEGENEFVEIGKRLQSSVSFSSDKDDWDNYTKAIKLKTYIYYSKQVLHDLLFNLANKSFSDEQLDVKTYPKFYKIVSEVQKSLEPNSHYLTYHDDLMKSYERTINEKSKGK